MAVLPVLTYPNPLLKKVSEPVESVDESLLKLFDDMYDTVLHEDGCGLAAPQVGVLKRLIVVDFSYRDPTFKPLFMANPEIIWASSETQTNDEACLSVEGGRGPVTRPNRIKVRYLSRENTMEEMDADAMTACAIQHEIDHLNGVLFIDHFSKLRRQMFLNRARKKMHHAF